MKYQEEYPIIKFQGLDTEALIIKSVFTKSIEWKYEEEYRFAKAPEFGGNGKHRLSPERIKEIILGPNMGDNEKEYIVNMKKKYSLEIEIYSSKISTSKYSIDKIKSPISN